MQTVLRNLICSLLLIISCQTAQQLASCFREDNNSYTVSGFCYLTLCVPFVVALFYHDVLIFASPDNFVRNHVRIVL